MSKLAKTVRAVLVGGPLDGATVEQSRFERTGHRLVVLAWSPEEMGFVGHAYTATLAGDWQTGVQEYVWRP